MKIHLFNQVQTETLDLTKCTSIVLKDYTRTCSSVNVPICNAAVSKLHVGMPTCIMFEDDALSNSYSPQTRSALPAGILISCRRSVDHHLYPTQWAFLSSWHISNLLNKWHVLNSATFRFKTAPSCMTIINIDSPQMLRENRFRDRNWFWPVLGKAAIRSHVNSGVRTAKGTHLA